MTQYEPILCAVIFPLLARRRRWEALRPVRAAASRNDNRSSAKAASERGYDEAKCRRPGFLAIGLPIGGYRVNKRANKLGRLPVPAVTRTRKVVRDRCGILAAWRSHRILSSNSPGRTII